MDEYRKKLAGLLSHIQAHTWEIETLQAERREFIKELERLERQKPQRGTEALKGQDKSETKNVSEEQYAEM